MFTEITHDLGRILEQLRCVDDAAVDSSGVSQQFLEIIKSSENEEMLCINGNPLGLIHFARLVLEVAGKGFEGAHHHFDENANVDHCDLPVVVRLKTAPWDLP